MNHVQLRAFHAVASTGSFTRAAQALHVTQPTLSGQVRELEERYGVKLFERRARGVELTELARLLLDITRRHFDLEADAERLLEAAGELVTGHLRVGGDAPGNVFPLLASFNRRYPGVRLSMTFGNSAQVLRGVRDRHTDIGVLADIPGPDGLHAFALRQDRLVVLAQRGHAWNVRRSIRLGELAGQRVILREPGSTTRAVLERALHSRGLDLSDTLEIGSREGVREAVAAGLGVGLVFESELGNDVRLHALGVRDARMRATEYAVCLQSRSRERSIRAFFELLEQANPLTRLRGPP